MDTHLFFTGTRTIPLLQQDPRIQAVVRIAITDLLGDLLFDDSFPAHNERIRLSRNALMNAGKSYRHDTMVQRLQNDIGYLDTISKIVRLRRITSSITDITSLQAENRISQYRYVVKKFAARLVLIEFGLKDGCGNKARDLLEGHKYIFPFKDGWVS